MLKRRECLISAELYEVISLASRYLFALLGILIVLRAFAWLLSDRAEKHARLRKLPDAGMIGELVVLAADSKELSPGMSVPVPYEGILGSVRSCDINLPASGVRKSHLSFSFVSGSGLFIHPFRGCETQVDGVTLDNLSDEKLHPLVHGSFLQIGSAVLRLRLFAGVDPAAGFDEPAGAILPPEIPYCANSAPSGQWQLPVQTPAPCPSSGCYLQPVPHDCSLYTVPDSVPASAPDSVPFSPDEVGDAVADVYEPSALNRPDVSGRRRRSDRWEADWSE